MAKARRAKSTRRTSNTRTATRTRKKKNNIDKNLVVVVMIITSLLLCVLIYAQSGWIGEHLSPVLGGIMGWIKYIIPVGTLAMAIKIAVDDKEYLSKKIVNYIINHEATSKVELSKDLNLSMPTVLSNVNELLANGIAVETGEYESTGGRKAKRISINPAYRYAVGIRITAKHAGFVLVNLSYEIEKYERIRLEFSTEAAYYLQLSEALERFLSDVENRERILGIGISIPGIVNSKERMLIKSHALQLENYSLSFLEQIFSLPVYFENDANAAMMAEDLNNYRNALYLSLNNTLGGAFCIDGKLIPGANQKAGEFGHMILVPGGKKCYCGKQGCADAYCAASVLTDDTKETLEQFMKKVEEQDGQAVKVWKEYLNNLAILISNLRMAYDMDIILGGEVGGYLADHMIALGKKVMEYNGFEHDARYLKVCSYKREASAVGVAKHYLQAFIKTL